MENNIKEKKKISKKFLAFGIMGLFAMVLVSALVVNYLSNTATAGVSVTSPMSIQFSNADGAYGNSITLPSTTGESTTNFWIEVKNLANNEIIAPKLAIKVSTDQTGATCADFKSITITDTWCHGVYDAACLPQNLVFEQDGVHCAQSDTKTVTITIPTMKYKVGQDTIYPVSFTFDNVESAKYTIEGQMVIA